MALTHDEKVQALSELKPGAEFTVRGDTIEWLDSKQSQPTDSELEAHINSVKYKDNRAAEYPSVVQQLDDIYHNGIDGWKATIKATKDKYPKP
tara:strand:+ start:934 stop:1212 length:279 start_codon:yes stop_codon:yes gene_type:complete